MPKLSQRLIFAEWFYSQLGYDILTEEQYTEAKTTLNESLKKAELGWDEQNVFYYRRILQDQLKEKEGRALNDDRLIEYDLNLLTYWKRVTKKREAKEHRALYPLPYQYLSLLFSEYYLDLWTKDVREGGHILLDSLNTFRISYNHRFDILPTAEKNKAVISEFTSDDLRKLASWMATGSGKTLIMHCQLLQLQSYLKERGLKKHFNKTILITPNEGLSGQHLKDFRDSDIPAKVFSREQVQGELAFSGDWEVEVVEITKLKEKTGVTTVDVAELGTNNLILIDEGHRGLAGEVEFKNRQKLCETGFSLEYSATFGQSINALKGNKIDEMGNLYAKSILFDYSYRHFYHDGYGKDFEILDYSEGRNTSQESDAQQHGYLTACLLRFYQQCLLYQSQGAKFAPYLLEDPLMIMVGGSVTGKKTYADGKNTETNRELSDVMTAIEFFALFCNDQTTSVQNLDLILRDQMDFGADNDVFEGAFRFVKKQYPVTEAGSAQFLYENILSLCFRSSQPAPLNAEYLKGSESEIGLRIGTAPDYFGVVKVGEALALHKKLAESEIESLNTTEQEFSVSLFEQIKEEGTPLRVLIGAKMFTEGWSCWRVSSMCLINVGKKEGSQIIQLFGRGVRLKGYEYGLKRSDSIPDFDHPDYLTELETLNVFGIKADYMRTFREYIEAEGVVKESEKELITIPTIEQLARTDLKVILPKEDKPDFKRREIHQLDHLERTKLKGKVTADWYGRLSSLSSRYKLQSEEATRPDPVFLKPENLKFLDYDTIYRSAVTYKQRKALYNLELSKEEIKALLHERDWYRLYLPEYLLEFDGFKKVAFWQEIATDLVLRYIDKFYQRKRDLHDAPYQELRTIKEILDAPHKTYNAQFLRNLRVDYLASIDKSKDLLITDLKAIKEGLENGNKEEYDANGVTLFGMASHAYHPLISVKEGNLKVSMKPAALNKHEKQFCDDLEAWLEREKDDFLYEKEFHLLRNQSRGRGISFFEEGNFYPDFIIWVLEGDKQHIYFLDPHGLHHASGFDDAKVNLHKHIKEIQTERLRDPDVTLDSYIISPTHRSSLQHWQDAKDPETFCNHNIVFMYDDPEEYVDIIFKN